MEHTNYCRQLVMQSTELRISGLFLESEKKVFFDAAIIACRESRKFTLPKNGLLLPDADFRALDESAPLRLPYQTVALEFPCDNFVDSGEALSGKLIIFLREEGDFISVTPAFCARAKGPWAMAPCTFLSKTNYLDRSDPREVSMKFHCNLPEAQDLYGFCVATALFFLNALACSNVRAQISVPKNYGKKIKAALPFDTYHVLTIGDSGRLANRKGVGGAHRSPREHLRRGHIRRLADGKKIWVNAAVIAASHSGGSIVKDYKMLGARIAAF